MIPATAETWLRRSLRQGTASTLRMLPIPGGQKWRIADIVADRLGTPTSPQAIAHMAGGFKMSVDLRKPYEQRIYYSGQNDPRLTRLFRRILVPGDTMIDGGANIGYFSLLAARLVGARGTVHAFEPVPQTCDVLRQNIHLNGVSTICINREALAASVGELSLSVPMHAETGQPLDRLATLAHLRSGVEVTVPACTLDEYAARSRIASIKLVKLDLEGGEMAAIAGMQRLLSEHRVLYMVCELNLTLLAKSGIPSSAIRETMREHDYRCYYIDYCIGFARMEYLNLIDVADVVPSHLEYGDYLFTAPGVPIPGRSKKDGPVR